MKIKTTALALFLAVPLLAGELAQGFKDGTWNLNLRYRAEYVDQETRADRTLASTLRTRLGWTSGDFYDLSIHVDFENTTIIGDDAFNSTANGVTHRPVVADPEDTEVNQINLKYSGFNHQTIILGRQRIILDDARFVGNVGWRQNEQTYDALRWDIQGLGPVSGSLIYFENTNRIFGEHHPNPISADTRGKSWIGHLTTDFGDVGSLVVFGHFFEFKDLPDKSHRNLGFRFTGSIKFDAWSLKHAWSYVNQSDYRDGRAAIPVSDPGDFSQDYIHITLEPSWDAVSFALSYELLGGDGTYAFATPYATLHAHNGWADQFLNTPILGLRDIFAKCGYRVESMSYVAVYHQFSTDAIDADLGKELDLLARKTVNDHIKVGVKAARFESDVSAYGSITKVMVFLEGSW